MKKTIMIVSTMLCIGLCVGGGITANAIEARYLACPDMNCPGRMIEREQEREQWYGDFRPCDEHKSCTQRLTWTVHKMQELCNECGYIRRAWQYDDNYQWKCIGQK